jgi:hypothetical protein
LSTFADGLFQYGGQPVGAQWASPWSTVRFVDSDNGSDVYDGLKPTQAMATIQAAVTASGRGDVIYVRPRAYVVGTGFSRYTEEVTTVLTQSDLSIIGTVNTKNPEYGVRWKHATNTTGYCLVNIAPALHVENIGFFAESAAGAIEYLNNGATNTQRGTDGSTIYNCVIKGARVYAASGGDGLTIQNTRFHCAYDGTVASIIYTCSANPGRRFLVRNCEFQDGNGTAASGPYINIAGVMSELLIRDCYFGADPTGNVYITITSSTGHIANCHFSVADVSTGRIVEGGVICTGIYDGGGLATAT